MIGQNILWLATKLAYFSLSLNEGYLDLFKGKRLAPAVVSSFHEGSLTSKGFGEVFRDHEEEFLGYLSKCNDCFDFFYSNVVELLGENVFK